MRCVMGGALNDDPARPPRALVDPVLKLPGASVRERVGEDTPPPLAGCSPGLPDVKLPLMFIV
jgi:hypothetical protein